MPQDMPPVGGYEAVQYKVHANPSISLSFDFGFRERAEWTRGEVQRNGRALKHLASPPSLHCPLASRMDLSAFLVVEEEG